MSDPAILAIDCGTQSLRALLFSPNGELLAKARETYAPYVSHRPGWTEQDPEIYWSALCGACGRLRNEHGDLLARVAGVGVTAQRNTMINVDRRGACLRPAILWLDQRKARPAFGCGGLLKNLLRLVRMDALVAGIQSEGKCNWIRQQQPRIWEATFNYLQVSGFLNYRLTGRFADVTASQIGHLPMAKGRTHETAGLGAAIVTAVGAGIHATFQTAMGCMVSEHKVFEPDPVRAELYRRLYRRVYRKIYKTMAPLYAEIRKITGYPA